MHEQLEEKGFGKPLSLEKDAHALWVDKRSIKVMFRGTSKQLNLEMHVVSHKLMMLGVSASKLSRKGEFYPTASSLMSRPCASFLS